MYFVRGLEVFFSWHPIFHLQVFIIMGPYTCKECSSLRTMEQNHTTVISNSLTNGLAVRMSHFNGIVPRKCPFQTFSRKRLSPLSSACFNCTPTLSTHAIYNFLLFNTNWNEKQKNEILRTFVMRVNLNWFFLLRRRGEFVNCWQNCWGSNWF